MDDFPYTDEQVRHAFDAAQQTTLGFDSGDIREILRGFHEAGIKVEFPEPRYYVVRDSDLDSTPRWWVRDRTDGLNVAWFYGPAAQVDARTHAERLNERNPS